MENTNSVVRKRYTYRGIIQGVGFRPAVYRCAAAAGVAGFVQNRRSVVIAEVEGPPEKIDDFEKHFRTEVPSAASIDSIKTEILEPCHDTGFSITASEESDYLFPPIPPDLALCEDCRRELLDPENRRYLYPFITCTQCGPRYSIVADTPFDRGNTSMAKFRQCPACLGEYTNPKDRRFHSQTNSCAVCGPRLRVRPEVPAADAGIGPAAAAVRALREGKVVAVQGIGGFHLAADPRFPAAVEKLRFGKEREKKPFALMVNGLAEARRLCYISEEEAELLITPRHPIVILEARRDIPAHLYTVSDTGSFGIMLPYTPLHMLLFFHPGIDISYRHLIMTSGNRSNEPIITDPDEAFTVLSDSADLFLYHDRPILLYSDDSIIRAGFPRPAAGSKRKPEVTLIRRSRGWVPEVLHLPKGAEAPVLAAGGDLKNSAAYADGEMVYLSPYAGDLQEPRAMEGFEQSVARILELYKVRPERIVCDMHPGYFSAAWARQTEVPEKIEVQHHHAHALSVMAEHGLSEAIGVCFDGTGYGTDGTVWGGEILYASRSGFRRLGAFRPFRLPGGEAAIYEPERSVFSLLHAFRTGRHTSGALFGGPDRKVLARMIERGLNSPFTTSAGRLFDAAAFLLGFVTTAGYEGEGPIKMEWAALGHARETGEGRDVRSRQSLHLSGHLPAIRTAAPGDCGVLPENWDEPLFILDPLPLFAELADICGYPEQVSPPPGSAAAAGPSMRRELSYLFHRRMAEAVCSGVEIAGKETGLTAVCLGGGVFQNMLLRYLLKPMLEARGFTVVTNARVSPGDGGLALGQVYYKNSPGKSGE